MSWTFNFVIQCMCIMMWEDWLDWIGSKITWSKWNSLTIPKEECFSSKPIFHACFKNPHFTPVVFVLFLGHVRKRDYEGRRGWTPEEKDFVCKYFAKELDTGVDPNYQQCREAQEKNQMLQRRKLSTIKDFIVAERKRRIKNRQKGGSSYKKDWTKKITSQGCTTSNTSVVNRT